MYLTDLTFLDESASTAEKDFINFEKLRKVAGVIQVCTNTTTTTTTAGVCCHALSVLT